MIERVVYNCRVYRRDTENKNPSHRNYFRRKKYDRFSKKERWSLLHRVIWEDHFGKIPFDHIIHHKDGNPLNNDIENLECIPEREHLSKYHNTGSRRYVTEKICEKCGNLFRAKQRRSRFCAKCSNPN